ncbi:MAG TPA: DUF2071 domain-containing protein [Streptosporangiaceae bacterium]|nr:DUF2071 domain-containing protein [Streptosporangiaceae bacterium]
MSMIPDLAGTIDRRLLINYRVDAEVLRRFLPPPFRPQLAGGAGVAGICMIRLTGLRPAGLPEAVGLTTENAAHRVAVEWDGPGGPGHGVYIPRRDTESRLTAVLGGRLFPGEHHRARFDVREAGGRYEAAFASLDGTARVAVTAELAGGLPPGSVFASLADASAFFESDPLGYSATGRAGRFEGLELRCEAWRIEPLLVTRAESSFFADESAFPKGSAELDSAFLMRDIPATWHARPALRGTRQPIMTARRAA